jgi:SAM-dependent methyltransferase
LNDLGCGYGALLSYLADHHGKAAVDYVGIDLSPAMIRRARRLWRHHGRAKFVVAHMSPRIADYSVASGIFNVKLDQSIDRWERFIVRTLSDMKECSRYGFAVNFKMHCPLSDAPRSQLYHTAAEPWICYCKQKLGLSVELVTAYGLREFTLIVRNEIVSHH